MRTKEQFNRVHQDAVRFIKFHNKEVWIVPTESDYCLSVIRPEEADLPCGTLALEVGPPIVNQTYTIRTELPSLK